MGVLGISRSTMAPLAGRSEPRPRAEGAPVPQAQYRPSGPAPQSAMRRTRARSLLRSPGVATTAGARRAGATGAGSGGTGVGLRSAGTGRAGGSGIRRAGTARKAADRRRRDL
ncbi:MAG: hypothetical protein JWO98_4576 [Frankiales bacterium]|nr:hypothetical protein [Frankiales bacterium]